MKFQEITINRFQHATIEITGKNEFVIYIDPFLCTTEMSKADIIVCTHDHYDHCSPEDIKKIEKETTEFVGPESVVKKLKPKKAHVLKSGKTVEVLGVKITGVDMYNVDKFKSPGMPFHAKGQGCGVIVEINGVKVYHAGDTDFIPEMKELQGKTDIACLPVSGTYVMNWRETVRAAEAIQAKVVIPIHYGAGIVGTEEDAINFKKNYKGKTEILG